MEAMLIQAGKQTNIRKLRGAFPDYINMSKKNQGLFPAMYHHCNKIIVVTHF
jgi:hypothetical protein